MSRTLWDFLPAHLARHRPMRPRPPCAPPPLKLRGLRMATSLHGWLAADMATWSEASVPLEERDTARMRRTARLTRPLPVVTYHTRPLRLMDAVTRKQEAYP